MGGRQEERARAARAALLPGAGARGAAVARARRRRSIHRASSTRRWRRPRRGSARGRSQRARRRGARLAQTFLRDGQLADAASTARPAAARARQRARAAGRGLPAARAGGGAPGDALGAEPHFRRALELRPSAELTDPTRGGVGGASRRRARPPRGGGLRLVQAPLGEVPRG